jgi:transformation/transcription domain-associated protein
MFDTNANGQQCWDSAHGQALLTQVLHMLINPLLLVTFARKEADEVLDQAIFEDIQNKIWRPLAENTLPDRGFGDRLRIELLQLTAMMVQYAPHRIVARKDVIKFAYNNIRLDDVTTKQAAYVLIARFIVAFETPFKITNQIFVALLRAHQPETRHLVRQALDVLTPALPNRLSGAPGNDPRCPTWARYTRKVLIEDGHTVPQLVNIYQLIVRHADQFYTCREYFLPQMVNTLPKLGLVSSSLPDTKPLMLDQIETILRWERRLLNALNTGKFGKLCL